MSYEPTVWKDGDLVTSAKLNKIEQGIVSEDDNNNIIYATPYDDTLRLNKTWQEIWDNKYTIICLENEDSNRKGKLFLFICSLTPSIYQIKATDGTDMIISFQAENANSYPALT